MKSKNPEAAHILHISDLHIRNIEEAETWHGQLADDLKIELGCHKLDALVLSDDIADKSPPEEYEAAANFLESLCREFGLAPSRLVVVPGNHDLNWKLSKVSYKLKYRENITEELKKGCFIKVSEDVLQVRDEVEYKRRFDHFRDFYQTVKEEPYPLD